MQPSRPHAGQPINDSLPIPHCVVLRICSAPCACLLHASVLNIPVLCTSSCPTCLYLFFLFTYFRITFSGRLMVTNLRLIWVSDKRTRTNLCKPHCNCQVTTACHQIIPFQSLSSPSLPTETPSYILQQVLHPGSAPSQNVLLITAAFLMPFPKQNKTNVPTYDAATFIVSNVTMPTY